MSGGLLEADQDPPDRPSWLTAATVVVTALALAASLVPVLAWTNREQSGALHLGCGFLPALPAVALVVLGWWSTRPKNPPPPGMQQPPPEVLEAIKRSKEQWEQQQRNMPR